MKLGLWKLAAWMVAAGLASGEEHSPGAQTKAALIIIPAGVSITVRVNEALSSKKDRHRRPVYGSSGECSGVEWSRCGREAVHCQRSRSFAEADNARRPVGARVGVDRQT